jgi:hypothetical protein
MSKETLEQKLKDATKSLLKMAQDSTYKIISSNCRFILSEIKDEEGNFDTRRRQRKKINDKKVPQSMQQLLPQLLDLYVNFYDINLHVYKALKNETIVEIAYYPKSSLDADYKERVINNQPMLHCKVAVPMYASENKQKFDINWEHEPLHHKWKMYWWRRKIDKELRKMEQTRVE